MSTGRAGKDGVVEREWPKKRPSSSSAVGESVGSRDDDDDFMQSLEVLKLTAWPSSPGSSRDGGPESSRPPGDGVVAVEGNGKPHGSSEQSGTTLPTEAETEEERREGLFSLPRTVVGEGHNHDADVEQGSDSGYQSGSERPYSDVGLVPAGWDREAAGRAAAAAATAGADVGADADWEKGRNSRPVNGDAPRYSDGVWRRGNLVMFPALVRHFVNGGKGRGS